MSCDQLLQTMVRLEARDSSSSVLYMYRKIRGLLTMGCGCLGQDYSWDGVMGRCDKDSDDL